MLEFTLAPSAKVFDLRDGGQRRALSADKIQREDIGLVPENETTG
jgi:hypothetical protein